MSMCSLTRALRSLTVSQPGLLTSQVIRSWKIPWGPTGGELPTSCVSVFTGSNPDQAVDAEVFAPDGHDRTMQRFHHHSLSGAEQISVEAEGEVHGQADRDEEDWRPRLHRCVCEVDSCGIDIGIYLYLFHCSGKIRTHGIGGGHKRKYRWIDFQRLRYESGKEDQPFDEKVVQVRYDPCR